MSHKLLKLLKKEAKVLDRIGELEERLLHIDSDCDNEIAVEWHRLQTKAKKLSAKIKRKCNTELIRR